MKIFQVCLSIAFFSSISLGAFTPGKWSFIDHYIFHSEKERPTKEEVKDSNGIVTFTAEYEYNKDGFLEKEIYKSSSGLVSGYTVYKYSQKRVISETLIDANNLVKETKNFSYDKNGNLTKVTILDAYKKEILSYKIKGSTNFHLKNAEVQWSDSKDIEYHNVKKDLDTDLIFTLEIINEARDVVSNTKYMYDTDGNLISRINNQGKLSRQNNIKYDDKKRVSGYTFHVKQGNEWTLLKTHVVYYGEGNTYGN
jgi:hypothetical protein